MIKHFVNDTMLIKKNSIKVIMLSQVIELELSSQLIKTEFKSEF